MKRKREASKEKEENLSTPKKPRSKKEEEVFLSKEEIDEDLEQPTKVETNPKSPKSTLKDVASAPVTPLFKRIQWGTHTKDSPGTVNSKSSEIIADIKKLKAKNELTNPEVFGSYVKDNSEYYFSETEKAKDAAEHLTNRMRRDRDKSDKIKYIFSDILKKKEDGFCLSVLPISYEDKEGTTYEKVLVAFSGAPQFKWKNNQMDKLFDALKDFLEHLNKKEGKDLYLLCEPTYRGNLNLFGDLAGYEKLNKDQKSRIARKNPIPYEAKECAEAAFMHTLYKAAFFYDKLKVDGCVNLLVKKNERGKQPYIISKSSNISAKAIPACESCKRQKESRFDILNYIHSSKQPGFKGNLKLFLSPLKQRDSERNSFNLSTGLPHENFRVHREINLAINRQNDEIDKLKAKIQSNKNSAIKLHSRIEALNKKKDFELHKTLCKKFDDLASFIEKDEKTLQKSTEMYLSKKHAYEQSITPGMRMRYMKSTPSSCRGLSFNSPVKKGSVQRTAVAAKL